MFLRLSHPSSSFPFTPRPRIGLYLGELFQAWVWFAGGRAQDRDPHHWRKVPGWCHTTSREPTECWCWVVCNRWEWTHKHTFIDKRETYFIIQFFFFFLPVSLPVLSLHPLVASPICPPVFRCQECRRERVAFNRIRAEQHSRLQCGRLQRHELYSGGADQNSVWASEAARQRDQAE